VTLASRLIDRAPETFFGVPALGDLDRLDAQVAFLGVPYDGGTPEPGLPTGQRGGPAAVRAASREQIDYPPPADATGDRGAAGWYDVEADRDYLVGVTMADVGDVAIQGSDTEANYRRIAAAVTAIAARGALMVAIGGDHSISYPLGRGMEPLGPIDVVHIDAHTDFLDDLDGARLTGASQLRRLAELPFVGTVAALGVRNVARPEIDGMRELGGRWATSLDVLERGAAAIVAETVREAEALYVSIDLDVLDSSIAPGHSLTEPGGLGYRELRAILVEVARPGRVVGFDVVELNPALDPLRSDRACGGLDRDPPAQRGLRAAPARDGLGVRRVGEFLWRRIGGEDEWQGRQGKGTHQGGRRGPDRRSQPEERGQGRPGERQDEEEGRRGRRQGEEGRQPVAPRRGGSPETPK
jgi:agmatinase